MKKKMAGVIVLVIAIIGVGLFLSTGGMMSDVVLEDYAVSQDNRVLTIDVAVMSSIGYVRTLKVKEDSNSQYVTFYSTYGLNSRLGAKTQFDIVLSPSCEAIYFYKGKGTYELVLRKNKVDDTWQKK